MCYHTNCVLFSSCNRTWPESHIATTTQAACEGKLCWISVFFIQIFHGRRILPDRVELQFKVSQFKIFLNFRFIFLWSWPKPHINSIYFSLDVLGKYSVVGVATCYGMDGPGMKSRCGWDFLDLSKSVMGLTHPPLQWVPGLFLRVKQLGCGIDHPPWSSTEVKERVELYLCSCSGPLWPLIGLTLLFLI